MNEVCLRMQDLSGAKEQSMVRLLPLIYQGAAETGRGSDVSTVYI